MRTLPSARAVVVALAGLGALPATAAAQGPAPSPPVRMEVGAMTSYFPSYVMEDSETRRWGVSVVARIGRSADRHLEVAYTHIPQRTTTSSSAPRLHALRAMFAASVSSAPDGRVRLTGAVGMAALKIDAQKIDCGDYPLCSEWAPSDGTRFAPVAGAGTAVRVADRARVFGDVRAYRPLGSTWSPGGDPAWLTEVGLGIGLRL